jgi:hypothetical protein
MAKDIRALTLHIVIYLKKISRKLYTTYILRRLDLDTRHHQMGNHTSQQCYLTQRVCALLGVLKTYNVQLGSVGNE